MSSPSPTTAAVPRSRWSKPIGVAVATQPVPDTRLAFAALLAAVLSFSLLQTMVVPALPDLRRDLNASSAAMSWVLSAFLLTSAAGTVILSRLGDLYGNKRLMLVSLALLGAGTLLAAEAESIGVLIGARAVQGLGAATFPLAFGLVREMFPRDRVPVVVGTISAMFGIGFGIGLVVPGPVIDMLGWPWIFWFTLMVIAVAFVAVAVFVPTGASPRGGQVDCTGAALFTVGLTASLLAITRVQSGITATLAVLVLVGFAAFVGFVAVERRVADPLIDFTMLRKRAVLVANVVAMLFGLGIYGAFSLVPQFVQTPPSAGYGFGATATQSGLFLLPLAVTMLVAGPVAGRVGSRWGFKPTLFLACCVAAGGLFVLAAGLGAPWAIATGAGILGVGAGFAFSSIINVVVDVVDVRDTGQATGVNTIVRTVGGAIGAQVAAAVLTASLLQESALPTRSAYITAFVISALALALAAVVTLAAPKQHREPVRTSDS